MRVTLPCIDDLSATPRLLRRPRTSYPFPGAQAVRPFGPPDTLRTSQTAVGSDPAATADQAGASRQHRSRTRRGGIIKQFWLHQKAGWLKAPARDALKTPAVAASPRWRPRTATATPLIPWR